MVQSNTQSSVEPSHQGAAGGRFQLAGRVFAALVRHRRKQELCRAEKPLRSALPFLSTSLVTGVMAVLLAFYTPCYALTVDGVSLGYVQDPLEYQAVAQQVTGQVEGLLGESYPLSANLAPVLAAKEDVLSPARLSDQIYEIIPAVTQAYVLTVDDQDVAAAADKAALDEALAQLQDQYTDEDTLEVSFLNNVKISRKYLPSDTALLQGEELLAALSQKKPMEDTYVIQEGDQAQAVAEAHGMILETLQALNPNTDLTALEAGHTLTVLIETPVLSVCTKENASYRKIIPSPREERTDDTLYDDQVRTIQAGSPGQAQVESVLTLVDGQVWSEDVLSSQTLVEPVTTIEAVGTQERPDDVATGSFIWPTQGDISSPFGYRDIFGSVSFHTGLDISNKPETAIIAADAGTVTYVGYKGSYGNLVVVDHNNGFETYYAHCSSTLVVEGETVSQGELIATTGKTGRVTGNHLHFEVRIDGEPVDPQNYLP